MIDLIVLAAGRGERLGGLGDDTPKWLLEVSGTTLAERQLDAVSQIQEHHPGVLRSVQVVVGHASSAISRFAARRAGLKIQLIDNPRYAELNNWYSLLLALRALRQHEPDPRIVVFNGDLMAPADWFARFLLDSSMTASEGLIAVDTRRPVTDESMKVSVNKPSSELLERIGKVGVEDPVGEYVGMFMARASARHSLETALKSFVGFAEAADNWYEHAIGQTAEDGTPWVVWPTPNSDWIEIDDKADYELALEMNRLP